MHESPGWCRLILHDADKTQRDDLSIVEWLYDYYYP